MEDKSKPIKKTELKKISEVKYVGNKETFTNKLTKEEIKDLLDGYSETEFDKLKIGFNIRYFKKNDKEKKMEFRMGGSIIKIENDYIIVSNGKVTWSVQELGNVFYQQMPLSKLKKQIEGEYNAKITELYSYIRSLEKKNKMLEEKINNLMKD